MSRLSLLPISLGAALAACAGSPDAGDDYAGGGGGKADGATRIMKCSQSAMFPSNGASIDGSLLVYDLGNAASYPDDLPSGVADWIADQGFSVKKYRVITKLLIEGKASQNVDRYYWGNLFVGDGDSFETGHAYSRGDAYELSIPMATEDGPYRLAVALRPGLHSSVALDCETMLPSEDEAAGGDPAGLALDFTCSAAATSTEPVEAFSFSAIRVDRPASIELVDNNVDPPVTCHEDSDLVILNENYSIGADDSQLVVRGDGAGIEFADLVLQRPTAAGQTITGEFTLTDSDETVLSQRAVTCSTSASAQ